MQLNRAIYIYKNGQFPMVALDIYSDATRSSTMDLILQKDIPQ